MEKYPVKLVPLRLKVITPFSTGGTAYTSRDVWFLQATINDMLCTGEISPLQGFSNENARTITNDFSKLQDVLPEALRFDKIDYDILFANFSASPAFLSGLEQLILSASCNHNDSSLDEFRYFSILNNTIPVNAAIGIRDLPIAVKNINTAIKEGFTCVKLKVGRNNVKDDISFVTRICEIFGDKITIRLDANQHWDFAAAEQFCLALNGAHIQYIEEPLKNPDEIEEFGKVCSIPIALDESLSSLKNIISAYNNPAVDTLVFKPAVMGGIIPTITTISAAMVVNKNITITSSLDSPIGKRKAVVLAAITKNLRPAGLDTVRFFKNTGIEDIYPVVRGQIKVDRLII